MPAFTTLGGAFERETGAAPFALPASWRQAKDKLGLVFDGNIHSLGGAYWYEPGTNRAVAVTSSAILESLDKIYNAPALAKELRGQ